MALPDTVNAGPVAGPLLASSLGAVVIYEIAPDGTQTIFAQLSLPRGLALDSFGNLFGTALIAYPLAGAYTGIVRDNGNSVGIGLVEVYSLHRR